MNLFTVLYAINKVVWWEPSSIFFGTEKRSFSGALGGGYTHYNYTKLGNFFEKAPQILQLIKVPYYIVTWVVLAILKMIWGTVELFFPNKYSSCFW